MSRDPQTGYMQDVIVIVMASLERLRLNGYVASNFGGSPLTARGYAHAIEARTRRFEIPIGDVRKALVAMNGRQANFGDDVEPFAHLIDMDLRGCLPDLPAKGTK